MKRNIHPIERAVRIIGGAVLVSLAYWGPENQWFLLGMIPLFTGLIGWCPPYAMLGISTAKTDGGCGSCGCGSKDQAGGAPS